MKLHWQRCCYVFQIWNQSDKTNILYPPISEWGWSYVDNKLVFKWDSKSNLKRIEKYRKLWTSGCHCMSTKPCFYKQCCCQKSRKPCGPACQCSVACFNKPQDPSIRALLHNDDHEVDEKEFDMVEVDMLTDDERNEEEEDESIEINEIP